MKPFTDKQREEIIPSLPKLLIAIQPRTQSNHQNNINIEIVNLIKI